MSNGVFKFNLNYVFIGIVIVIFGAYLIFLRQYVGISRLQAMFAVFIVFLGAIPGLITLLNKDQAKLIPLMPMHGIFYALTFGFPVLSNKLELSSPQLEFPGNNIWGDARIANSALSFDSTIVRADALSMALVLTIGGLICLYLGYYGFDKYYKKIKPIHIHEVSSTQQLRFAWVLFGCYVLLYLFPQLRNLPSVNQLSTPLIYISLGILTLLFYDHKLTVWQIIFYRIAQFFVLTNALVSGSLAPIVFLIVFFGVLYWGNKRRIPWHLIVLVALIMTLLNPIKQQFRTQTWYSTQEKPVTMIDKIGVMGVTAGNYYADKSMFIEVTQDKGLINRVANISLFAYTKFMTPEYVPYWHGDSYRTLWTSFIPRILWPGKPQATIGQDFGHRYLLLNPHDKGTSINLPWLIEFYINFGIFGLIAGMFFVGAFFRMLLQKLKVPSQARIEYVIAVTITFSLFYAESNFALMVGGMLPTFIVFTLLARLFTGMSFLHSPDKKRH